MPTCLHDKAVGAAVDEAIDGAVDEAVLEAGDDGAAARRRAIGHENVRVRLHDDRATLCQPRDRPRPVVPIGPPLFPGRRGGFVRCC